MSSFCIAKATHIFSAKNFRKLYIESAKTVNEMTLNDALNNWAQDLNLAGGRIHLMTVWHFMALSLSLLSFCHLDLTRNTIFIVTSALAG